VCSHPLFFPSSTDPTFFPGRAADLVLIRPSDKTTTIVGSFGVLHPEVLKAYDIPYPSSVLEIDLEPLM
jgi:phenylalanyl-tRNA synthetase beta chain